MNIGIIGTGWVSGQHLNALKKIDFANVTAIAGRNLPKAKALAADCGAKAYESYQEMLKKESLDAVFILLPPDAHGEVEQACAEAVPAVFVEKPISNNMSTALKVGEVFQQHKTIVSVGYMNRYRMALQKAAELFQHGDAPVMANGWWVVQMPPVAWWKDIKRSGGQFVEQCTHLVDAARAVMGDIKEVHAFSATGFITDDANYTNEDAVSVNIKFTSGAIGNFSTGAFPRNGTDQKSGIGLTISGRNLKCEFSGWGMALDITHSNRYTENIQPEDNIFELQDRAFLLAAKDHRPELILSNYANGIANLAVGCAAAESLKTGKIVNVSSLI